MIGRSATPSMRAASALVAAAVLLPLLPVPAGAHPGRLDASGCHSDTSSGSRHCHSGSGGGSGGGGGGGSFSGGGGSIDQQGTYADFLRRVRVNEANNGPGDFIKIERTPPKAYSRPVKSESGPSRLAMPGKVALVSQGDGDTVRVRITTGETLTIRLACIDAPETAQGDVGAFSRQTLAQLLSAGNLEIRPQTVDKYGRTVAEIFSNGRNLNVEMVRLGAAFAYRKYLAKCDQALYLQAENQAQAYKQGVWRWGEPIRPWDFRQNR